MNKSTNEQTAQEAGRNTAAAPYRKPLNLSVSVCQALQQNPSAATNTRNPEERCWLTLTNELSLKVTPEVNHVKIINSNNKCIFILLSNSISIPICFRCQLIAVTKQHQTVLCFWSILSFH